MLVAHLLQQELARKRLAGPQGSRRSLGLSRWVRFLSRTVYLFLVLSVARTPGWAGGGVQLATAGAGEPENASARGRWLKEGLARGLVSRLRASLGGRRSLVVTGMELSRRRSADRPRGLGRGRVSASVWPGG